MGDAIMKSVVRNDCPNGWVVQKFGGTSVGKFPEQVCPLSYLLSHPTTAPATDTQAVFRSQKRS